MHFDRQFLQTVTELCSELLGLRPALIRNEVRLLEIIRQSREEEFQIPGLHFIYIEFFADTLPQLLVFRFCLAANAFEPSKELFRLQTLSA